MKPLKIDFRHLDLSVYGRCAVGKQVTHWMKHLRY